MTLRLAVLVSGTGRSFANILHCVDRGELDVLVTALVSTRPITPALDLARDRNLPAIYVPWSPAAPDLIYGACQGADAIAMAGFFKFLPIRPSWEGRVLNIHPSLLPAHGGKGLYGDKVHASVLASGDLETGCTVHVVDNEYDHGRILEQIHVPVRADDNVESLATRVFEQEKLLYPRILSRIASGAWALPIN